MTDFDYLSDNFKAYANQKLNSLESEFTSSTARDCDIDAVERALKEKVENTKQDLSDRIDEVRDTITSRRPHPSDPDYARKRAQYVELLSQSVNGMDLLKAWLQNIFNQLKQIVISIIGWIANKIIGLARRIRDAFQSLLKIFF